MLLFFAFIFRFILFPLPGYEVDLNTFSSWFGTAAQYGPRVFYNVVTWCDYPPFNVYIFWGLGSIANIYSLFGTPQMFYLIKLLPSFFDIATTAVIFIFLRKRTKFSTSLLVAGFYAFNPAIIINSAIWGQFDAIYTFFLLLSITLFLSSRPKLSIVTLVISLLTKPQSIAVAPLIVFLIFKKYGWKALLKSMFLGVATVLAIIIPFEWSNPIEFLSNIYFGAFEGYAYTSVNAFNLWALGGLWVKETVFLFATGWILFGVLVAFVLYTVHKRFHVSGELLVIFSAFVLFLGFFMLPTRIHERYLFPVLSIVALSFPFLKKIRPIYIIITLTCFVNQLYVLYYLNLGTFIPIDDWVVIGVSLINLVTFMYVLTLLWDEFKGRQWLIYKPNKINSNNKVEEGNNAKGQ